MRKKHLLTVCLLFCGATIINAQTNPTAQTLPYAENFSTLAHTSTTYPAGWQGWVISTIPGSSYNTSAPTTDRVLIASSSASVNSGNVHNYNGKIGFLNTGSLDLGLVLAINTTNKRNIRVEYDVMTIRNPYDTTTNTRINEVTLQYRLGTTGSFTNLTGIEYQNNTITQIGSGVTTPQALVTRSILLPAVCDSEAVVQLRWASKQVSGGGSRPGFAVDNINVDTSGAATISLATASHAMEGVAPVAGSYTFSFTPLTASATTISYALTGSATFGTDYSITLSSGATPATLTAATGTITVPASVTSITATVTPINDILSEGQETVILTLSAPSGGYGLLDSTETLNITDDEATFIHTIQGTGSTATGGSYTIEAIVTGIYPTLSPAGFYVQEENADADSNPATSEGIFVVSSAVVAVGDKVKVSGTVLESAASPSFMQAVINNTTVSVINSSNPLPSITNINLPLSTVADYEKYEAMLVRFPDTLYVTDNYNLGRFGEVGLAKGGVVFQPTQLVDPNDAVASGNTASGASNLSAINAFALTDSLRSILLDDGRGTIPTLPFVNSDNTLRIGSTTTNITGILGYAFSRYRIQPVTSAPPSFNYATRPSVPSVGTNANVKIASFNVLNYFNGDGTGGGFPTARGAHSPAEFTRQRDKIINAIADINADVVGLIEIENDGIGATSAIQDLVNGLNTKMGANTYSIINDGATIQSFGTDAIRCGIIYKAALVAPVGVAMLSPHPVFNRPPLAQTFALASNGMKFNFIINHFKSKSCSGSTGADMDLLDGQACYNNTRKKQAGELMNFINTTVIPTSGSNNILSVGDYNAYYQEDPLDTFRAGGYTVLGSETNYSYLFNGQVGSLDNAIANDSMKAKITGIAKWNINSAEPILLDYNDAIDDGSGDFVNPWGNTYTSSPFRSSDHDPVIIGLDLTMPISVSTLAKQDIYKVYPNPAAEQFFIENTTAQATKWQMMNTLGQVVLYGAIGRDEHTTQVNMHFLDPGVYLIRIVSENGNVTATQLVKK